MAKLTDIPVVTSLDDADLIYAVDVSDTTDDPAGSSAAITKADLLASAAPTASSGASKVLLQEIELTTAGEFDFTDIPAGYDRLVIQGTARSDVAAAAMPLDCWINEDTTTANYRCQLQDEINSTNVSSSTLTPQLGAIPGALALAGSVSQISIELESPDSSDLKTVKGDTGYKETSSTVRKQKSLVTSAITGTVTRFRVLSRTGGLVGKLQLFGERAVSIVDAPTITTKIQVATITDPVSGKFSFDLTDYQDGDRVVIEGSLRNTVAGTAAVMYINGDTTTTNYKAQLTRSGDGTMLAQEFDAARILYITESTSPTGAYAQAKITLEDYAGPYKKTARGEFAVHQATDTMWSGTYGWYSKLITAPVTSILIESVAGSDILEGSLTCYIEKQGVIAATGGDPVTFTKKVEIARVTDPDGSGFAFTDIPAGYDRLMIAGSIAGTNAATNEIVRIYFNGDTTDTNYFYNQLAHYDAIETNSDGADAIAGVIAGANSVGESSFYAHIENPGAGPVKNAQFQSARYSTLGTQLVATKSDVYHDSMTAALTSISIVGASASAIAGTLILYGEKEETFYPSNVVETASFDMPVVQSARFDAGTVVEWSSEPGWTISKNAVGKYTVTFPTTAVSATEQSLVATVNGVAADATIWSSVNNITTTSCDVAISYENTLFTDLPFSLVRRLPDTSVANKVILPTVELYHGEWSCGTAQVLTANIDSIIDYDTKVYEVGGTDQVVNGVFTAPRDGVYKFECCTSMTTSGGDSILIYRQVLTGVATALRKGQGSNSSANEVGRQWGHTVTMKAGDTVEPRIFAVTSAKTLDANPSHNRMSISQLATGLVTAQVDPSRTGEVVKEEIARITDPVSGQFDFTGLSLAGYDKVYISGSVKSDIVTDADIMQILFNGDTTLANYDSQRLSTEGGATTRTNSPDTADIGIVPGAAAGADYFASTDIQIPFPASSNFKIAIPHIISSRGDASPEVTTYAHQWKSTAPITQITLGDGGTQTFSGTLILYGERTL